MSSAGLIVNNRWMAKSGPDNNSGAEEHGDEANGKNGEPEPAGGDGPRARWARRYWLNGRIGCLLAGSGVKQVNVHLS